MNPGKWVLIYAVKAFGFQSLGGESRLQLLPTPWPADALPSPTSSLLSISSSKGLLAAGGPESIILASTDKIREAFANNAGTGVIPFEPQLIIQLRTRISQVAFSSDDNLLVASAEIGGGLAIYDTQSLLQGNTQTALEIPTGGVPLRALVPNPNPPAAQFFAIVTTQGDLMIADVRSGEFSTGTNGQVLKNGVSSLSWSVKGKQLVAGLADGTVIQLTPDGQKKGEIPRPPDLVGEQHGKICLPNLRSRLYSFR